MGTKEMTGARRHYQIVDFGFDALSKALSLAFPEGRQPTYFILTGEGVFAASDEGVLMEHRKNDEEVFPLFVGSFCQTIAAEALKYFQGLPRGDREAMTGSQPRSTGDCPRADGWSLIMHGREDGALLVQIKPAWWS
jgi:hypothetical protein